MLTFSRSTCLLVGVIVCIECLFNSERVDVLLIKNDIFMYNFSLFLVAPPRSERRDLSSHVSVLWQKMSRGPIDHPPPNSPIGWKFRARWTKKSNVRGSIIDICWPKYGCKVSNYIGLCKDSGSNFWPCVESWRKAAIEARPYTAKYSSFHYTGLRRLFREERHLNVWHVTTGTKIDKVIWKSNILAMVIKFWTTSNIQNTDARKLIKV